MPLGGLSRSDVSIDFMDESKASQFCLFCYIFFLSFLGCKKYWLELALGLELDLDLELDFGFGLDLGLKGINSV